MISIKELLNLTYYTSSLDKFLAEFDKSHPALSDSQRLEKEKYARIFKLRDRATKITPKESLWDKF